MKKKIVISIIILLFAVLLIELYFIFPKSKKNELKISNNIQNSEIIVDENGMPKYIEGSYLSTTINSNDDVYKALNELKDIYGFENSRNTFNILRTDEVGNIKYYRVQQKYNNIIVYGKELILTVNKNNKILSVTGNYYDIQNEDYYINESNIVNDFIEKNKSAIINSNQKYYYIKDEIVYLTIVIDAITENGYYDFIYDKNGNLIDKVEKSNYSSTNMTMKNIFNEEVNITLQKEKNKDEYYNYYDENRKIYIIDGTTIGANRWNGKKRNWKNTITFAVKTLDKIPISIIKKENGYMLYDKKDFVEKTDNENVIVDASTAMYNLSKTYDYYKNVLGRKGYDNNNSDIYTFIDVKNDYKGTEKYENAYWDGTELVIGSMNDITLSGALDIVAHEYTHAVSRTISNFTYKGESGALSEAYSDILGSLVEGKNFEIGESVKKLRNMANPNEYNDPCEYEGNYYFPTDTKYYNKEWREKMLKAAEEAGDELTDWKEYDNGGVHVNNGVPNYTAYLMYENGAFSNKEEMAKVWYNSLFMLSSSSNFEDCAIAVIESAKNLGLSSDKVKIIKETFIKTKMMKEKSKLTGTVTDKETKKPLEGVLVSACIEKIKGLCYDAYTDKNGKYEIENLLNMKYIIYFDLSKYSSEESSIDIKEKISTLNFEMLHISENENVEAEVVFVLDISKSMDESDPSDTRKQIMSNILYSLDDKYSFSLITFSGIANLVNTKMNNSANEKKKLMTDIFNIANDNGMNECSGTNGREALTKALSLFIEKDTRKYVIFLTDGVDTKESGKTYDEIIEYATKNKIRILSIGLGSGKNINEEQLIKLGEKTNGKYYNAIKSDILNKFNKRLLEEIE